MAKYNLSDDVPAWLCQLPHGKYTISDLEVITGLTRSNIFMRLESLNVSKVTQRVGNYWKNLYDWKGASYYWDIIYKEKIKRVKQYEPK